MQFVKFANPILKTDREILKEILGYEPSIAFVSDFYSSEFFTLLTNLAPLTSLGGGGIIYLINNL